MKVDIVRLIYFSPTGTTKKVLDGIAETIGAEEVQHIDLTRPGIMKQELEEIKDGLAIIGAPVYGGRIPVEAEKRLRKLKADNIPAVIIAVYGNREYEDALVELRDIAVAQGFKPIAASAFIGEHSFSSEETPLAAGRPDMQDIEIARDLGKKIAGKMKTVVRPEDEPAVSVPGNSEYKERRESKKEPPVTDEEQCMKCATCLSVCPTGAISVNGEVVTDASLCILCCACVKNCPVKARKLESPMIKRMMERLIENAGKRKEPEIFLK